MRIRIEGVSDDERDQAEALLRLVFELGDEPSPDYRNRRRRQGDERARAKRRYFNNVRPRQAVELRATLVAELRRTGWASPEEVAMIVASAGGEVEIDRRHLLDPPELVITHDPPGVLRTRPRSTGRSADGKSITCPKCGRTSHHPTDVAEGYCGACNEWTTGPRLVGP